MAWFGKTRKVLDEVQRDSREAQAQVDQTKAEMRARGLDVDQATQQFQTAMASGAASDMATMGQRAARLMTDGIDMPATVLTIVLGEQSMMTGNGVPVTIGLTVEPPMAVPYQALAQQVMVADMAQQLHEGSSVTVKVAPDDPQSLMVWDATGGAGSESTAASESTTLASVGDHVGRLAKLQSLRAAGAITDAEFEAQKARILAE